MQTRPFARHPNFREPPFRSHQVNVMFGVIPSSKASTPVPPLAPMEEDSLSSGEPAEMWNWMSQELAGILDNPIAVREWRLLRRRARNWRAWVGMKRALSPTVWGAPVILAFSVAPYALWVVLACLRSLHLIGNQKVSVDLLLVLTLVFWFYVEAISLTLGATAVVQEREQERWDQLRLTRLSRREQGAGFLWGRLGPIWASALATSALWGLLLPSYSALLAAYLGTCVTQTGMLIGSLIGLGTSLLVGEVGLLTSARFKTTAAAMVMAVLLGLPVGLLGALCLLAVTMMAGASRLGPVKEGLSQRVTGLLVFAFLFYALFVVVRDAMEVRLDT
jgi:hypothetical protein